MFFVHGSPHFFELVASPLYRKTNRLGNRQPFAWMARITTGETNEKSVPPPLNQKTDPISVSFHLRQDEKRCGHFPQRPV